MAKPRMTKVQCLGCRDDFYNDKNPYDVKECWAFKTAEMAKRKSVHMDERPPWTRKPEWRPGCYRKPGYIYVDPKVTC